ncbi:MAG: alpha-rhamnosidase [Clostridiales bacterium]|nr:alpha-rhamnosidase [Clostridiales bacterium]
MACWIWYFGDLELYHSCRMHMRRDEFDYHFPPFWRLDDAHKNVVFRKEFVLENAGTIRVHANGRGMLEVDGRRYPYDGREIALDEGRHVIEAKLMSEEVPLLFVKGAVESDETWDVSCYDGRWVKAGANWFFREADKCPVKFPFIYKELQPASVEACTDGVLYDFGRESFGPVTLADTAEDTCVWYGESREEALSPEAILQQRIPAGGECRLPARAFRYIRVSREVGIRAENELLPLRRRGKFSCSDVRLNRIWDVAHHTFHLCSREFFLDGIKRDRWVWSGDAYQSYLINRYCFNDREIMRRTILALRGRDPVPSHINTILDYSFFWIMSLEEYHLMIDDTEFLRRVWPLAVSLMDYCLARRDENGFAANEGNGWIFVDWAEMDKEYAVCAEQMLLLRALEAMAHLAAVVGEDSSRYLREFNGLRGRIDEFFWDEEKGAYIDSYASGKRNVTRHANIFALLFGYAGKKRERILRNVLLNDAVPAIRTPYFKFYELDALCDAGETDEVLRRIREYWGSMVDGGATSIWEEYSPDEPMEAQYGMYGDKFGKSLCHAWGASPIYLLGRWFMGVKPTSPGYRTFEVRPQAADLDWFEGTVPVGPWLGEVHIRVQGGVCTVCATVDGGTLYWQGREYPLEKRVPICVGEA